MRRRWSLVLAFASALTAATAWAEEPTPRAEAEAVPLEWVFHYYMAYDNDLEGAAAPILDMLRQGLTSDRVAVVVSADLRGPGGMRRIVLRRGDQTVEVVDEEGSADEAVLARELEWVGEHLPARKHAVVFLNHGGALGQMSYDETPATPGKDWLYPPEVGAVLAEWRGRLAGEVELVFYQQCGKGSLENYYAFRDAAKFVMGSETVVGAPNAYYAPALRAVCERPDLDGGAVAELFARHEAPRMFTDYAALDATALRAVPGRLDAVLEPLLAVPALRSFPLRSRALQPTFSYPTVTASGARSIELFYDGLGLLEALYQANGLDRAPLEAFAAWVKGDLLRAHRISPLQGRKAGGWCGFSVFVPLQADLLARYRGSYAIYRDTRLAELHERLMGAVRRELLRRARRSRGEGADRPSAPAPAAPEAEAPAPEPEAPARRWF